MQSVLRLRIASVARLPSRTFTTTHQAFAGDDTGRGPEEHVTNQNHKQNIHADASNRGQQARAEDMKSVKDAEKNSGATSETSTSTARQEEAKSGRKDRGMGLQDERGGKGHTK